jgi:SAM-dependent methyltransferase
VPVSFYSIIKIFKMNSPNNWHKTFFTGLALESWAKVTTPEFTNAEIKFIKEIVTLKEGAKLLDVACGSGRHSIAFAKEGYNATAIDIAEENIRHLQQAADTMKLPVTAIQGDIVESNISEDYDLAICMGNSFSYFPYHSLLAIAKKIQVALKRGGTFIIHTGALAESILPAVVTKDWMDIDDMLFMVERKYHAEDSVLQSDYRITKKGSTEYKTAWHYVFTLSELRRLLFDAGFTDIKQFGSLDNAIYKLGDKQAYIVATK